MADPNLGDFYDATPLDYLEHSRNNNGGTDKPQLTNFGRGEEASDEEFYTQMRDVLTSGAGPSAALEVFEYIQQFDFDGLKSHLQQKSEDGVEDLTLLLEERERGGYDTSAIRHWRITENLSRGGKFGSANRRRPTGSHDPNRDTPLGTGGISQRHTETYRTPNTILSPSDR